MLIFPQQEKQPPVMAQNPQSVQSTVDAAVVPLNQVIVADLQAGASRFDGWLRSCSGGYVTLDASSVDGSSGQVEDYRIT